MTFRTFITFRGIYYIWGFYMKSRRYDFSDILAHAVVISRKTVKSAKNTICDTCALNSQSYEISDILGHTIVISSKTVKSAKNTICDTCCTELAELWNVRHFRSYSCNKQ